MTQNELRYWDLQEQKRRNAASEYLAVKQLEQKNLVDTANYELNRYKATADTKLKNLQFRWDMVNDFVKNGLSGIATSGNILGTVLRILR